ncbi:lytic transglycosylase domain-containing protein [Variovorax sp. J22P168]|uniref:lytic transglycosylase domain-containing protein n=1 Tax=Variovorax jilinensis TaxID=3053513 RepID=UPI00257549AE|nr:lytic transglycosylase domain-containing protein [Variovorax sp. J22P168]MDM0015041.1 lytic transglycosylase domain-containing protein [Variovorax sp. J22P168]
MRARELLLVVTALGQGVQGVLAAPAPSTAEPLTFEKLAAECAPDIHPTTLKGVVTTESSWNPYAIGVVGGRLDRQPRSHAEAVAAARELERKGFNFSMGLGQVNRHNLAKYGETYETIFEPCRNLKAGGAILKDCYHRAKAKLGDEQEALRAAFSCYYSGNFTRGFKPDSPGQPSYVQKVIANAVDVAPTSPIVPAVKLQAVDGAVSVRSTAPLQPKATAASSASAPMPAQWVVFAEAPGAPATAQLVTPRATSTASTTPSTSALPATTATPPRAGVAVTRDAAPFVQFVN